MFKKTTLSLAILLAGITNSAFAAPKTPILQQLTPLVLATYEQHTNNDSNPIAPAADSLFTEPTTPKQASAVPPLSLSIKPASPFEIVTFETQLFSHCAAQFPGLMPNTSICDSTDLQKLAVLGSQNTTHSIQHLFSTKTYAGDIYTQLLLATPTADTSLLQKRQQIIEHLLQNPELLDDLEKQLTAAAEIEPLLAQITKPVSTVEKRILEAPYFSSKITKWANRSPALLATYYGAKNTLNLFRLIPTEIVGMTLGSALQGFISNPKAGAFALFTDGIDVKKGLKNLTPNSAQGFKDGCKMLLFQHSPLLHLFEKKDHPNNTFSLLQKQAGSARSGGDWYYSIIKALMNDGYKKLAASWFFGEQILANQDARYPESWQEKLYTYPAALGLPIYMCVKNDITNYTNIKTFIKSAQLFADILANFQTKTWSIAQLNRATKKISELTANTPLQHVSESLAGNTKANTSLKSLIQELIANPVFDTNAYAIKNTGILLATHYTINSYKKELLEPLIIIGIIDSYVAAARYIQSLKEKQVPVTQARFSEYKQPYCAMTNYWNPLITHSNTVYNTTVFAHDGMRHMILTGPNGSGKSTNSKAIMLNIILAQTFGFACAEKFELAPYTKVLTAFNEQENIAANLSSFMAEKQRISQLCDAITYMDASERAFLFFDEAVKGTVEEAAGEIILDTCLALAKQPQAHSIIITHTEKPTEAEALTNGLVKNYFVQVDMLENTFKRTFKLQEGKASWWFDNPGIRKQFIQFLH